MSEPGKRASVHNEIRDEGRYRMVVSIEGGKPNAYRQRLATVRFTNNHPEWEQQRLVLDPKVPEHCAIKRFESDEGPDNGGIDLERTARKMAKEEKASPPYTARVCIAFQFEWADVLMEVFDESRGRKVQKPKLEGFVFSAGCFDYTVKSQAVSEALPIDPHSPPGYRTERNAYSVDENTTLPGSRTGLASARSRST